MTHAPYKVFQRQALGGGFTWGVGYLERVGTKALFSLSMARANLHSGKTMRREGWVVRSSGVLVLCARTHTHGQGAQGRELCPCSSVPAWGPSHLCSQGQEVERRERKQTDRDGASRNLHTSDSQIRQPLSFTLQPTGFTLSLFWQFYSSQSLTPSLNMASPGL